MNYSWRRLLRFRMRTLLLLVTVAAALLAYFGQTVQAYRREQQALAKLPGPKRLLREVPRQPMQIDVYY